MAMAKRQNGKMFISREINAWIRFKAELEGKRSSRSNLECDFLP